MSERVDKQDFKEKIIDLDFDDNKKLTKLLNY